MSAPSFEHKLGHWSSSIVNHECWSSLRNDRDNRVAAIGFPLSTMTTPRLRFIAWFATHLRITIR
ncbi:MAG TPA: hypothetical protein DDX19_00125 [Rhodopirellula baltica]|nr:hypothetical protein [Rhodopirellula baltica]